MNYLLLIPGLNRTEAWAGDIFNFTCPENSTISIVDAYYGLLYNDSIQEEITDVEFGHLNEKDTLHEINTRVEPRYFTILNESCNMKKPQDCDITAYSTIMEYDGQEVNSSFVSVYYECIDLGMYEI